MSLFLKRNNTDPTYIELIQRGKYRGEREEYLWAVVCVDGLKEGAVGELRRDLELLRNPTEVVIVRREEWDELSGHR